MINDFKKLILLGLIIFAAWFASLSVFFAQDDFILINNFSQSNLIVDIGKVFGAPEVTHWRPIHNLYFLVTGNLFGKVFALYHLLTILIVILSVFTVYKIQLLLSHNERLSLFSSVVFGLSPVHFVSVFWISGGAVLIGFWIFSASFYFFLIKRLWVSGFLFLISLLASEAMIIGLLIFFAWIFLNKKMHENQSFSLILSLFSLSFILARLLFLTPKQTFDAYRIVVSGESFNAFRYYFSRIAGFPEVSGDLLLSLMLLAIIIVSALFLVKRLHMNERVKLIKFFASVVILGLFPFLLIPNSLSPHYMYISLWGFSSLVAIAFEKTRLGLIFLIFISWVYLLGIFLLQTNNWVIDRSQLARAHLERISEQNLSPGSKIIFADDSLSSSRETYFALGAGAALDFWFKDMNYSYCFSEFENCSNLP